MLIFWVVTPCRLVGGRWRQYVARKLSDLPASAHGFTAQKVKVETLLCMFAW